MSIKQKTCKGESFIWINHEVELLVKITMSRAAKTIKNVDNVSPPYSLGRRANARNASFETLHGGQFTLSTQLIILNYPVFYNRRIQSLTLIAL